MSRKKYLKMGLFIAFIFIGIGYFYLFFQKGIYYENNFLKKSKNQDEIVYEGIVAGDLIKIGVKEDMKSNKEALVHYMVADRLDVTYRVKEQYNDKEFRTEFLPKVIILFIVISLIYLRYRISIQSHLPTMTM